MTPVGLLLPSFDAVFFYGVVSKVTSDCLADCITPWWESVRERFRHISTLVIHLDNGPENHSRRPQFRQRLVDFVHPYRLHGRLASDPPYHSQYNPIERWGGILENHWNGALLDSVEAVLAYARTMTWKSLHPTVHLVTKTYRSGVHLTKEAMNKLEKQIQRLPGLEKWFVDSHPPHNGWDT